MLQNFLMPLQIYLLAFVISLFIAIVINIILKLTQLFDTEDKSL